MLAHSPNELETNCTTQLSLKKPKTCVIFKIYAFAAIFSRQIADLRNEKVTTDYNLSVFSALEIGDCLELLEFVIG